jgi:DNA-binding transcriptional MerR regulator
VLQKQVAAVVLIMATAKRKRVRAQADVVIPEKIYFRIGEVSQLADLPTYVLRFWETEFPQLKPTKSSTGQRMYRRRDVEYVIEIRRLLYEDGFTIAGAREKLREEVRLTRSRNQPAAQSTSQSAAQPAPQVLNPRPERPVRTALKAAAQNTAQNVAQNEPQNISQQALLFPANAPSANDLAANGAPVNAVQSRDELRRVRQQLRDVLNLLS